MKIKWSTFYTLFLLVTLVSCGSEEFGSVPKSTTEQVDGLTDYSHSSCSQYTLIKPKVDVLYLVDNSGSNFQIPQSIKDGIIKTPARLSTSFDYRVIGAPLLETVDGNQDYQVMTNSADLAGIVPGKRVTNANNFNFFSKAPLTGPGHFEKGLGRTVSFIDAHKNGLLRDGAHLVIVIVSNGRDQEVEIVSGNSTVSTSLFTERLDSLRNHKTQQNLTQLRLMAVTAEQHQCKEGWWSANNSYVKMAKQLYSDSMSSDNNYEDSYNLCNTEYTKLFDGINSSIQQQVLKHHYRYWPVPFANTASDVSFDQLKVYKVSQNGTSTELASPAVWTLDDRGTQTTVNTRELPSIGEPASGRYFIKFQNGHLITYPDCVLVKSVSQTEYFGYVVLPQKPLAGSIAIRINGTLLPSSAFTDETATVKTINIKVDNPTANPPGSANPPLMKTGFMVKLKPAYYYKSGDSVQANFTPAPIQ